VEVGFVVGLLISTEIEHEKLTRCFYRAHAPNSFEICHDVVFFTSWKDEFMGYFV